MESMRMLVGVVDYVVLALVLVICVAVGIYSGREKPGTRASSRVERYLLGNRKMHVLPVSFSIMATNLSAVTMAGTTLEIYLFGFQYVIALLLYSLGIVLVGYFIVPIFHNDTYVSVYEYLEKRFDKRLRLIFSFSYVTGTMIFLGVVLYVPAVSLTIVSGIRTPVTVLVIGVSCTIYCILGGFTAVIWTDFIQSLLMMFTLILFIIKGTIDTGGLRYIYNESVNSGFLGIMSWYDEINYRHSVLGLFFMGLYYALKDVVLNQSGAQRILSVKNADAAKMSSYLSAFITLIFCFLLGLCGTIMYIHFRNCNPLQLPAETGITSIDQLFVYSTVKFLREWPGMAGLALSGLMSGSISTLSSYINAFAALTLEDYMKHFCPGLVKNERRQILVCKLLTGVFGLLAVVCAFLIPLLGGALKAAISTLAVTSGPMGGILLLGIFVRRSNTKAAFIGLFIGLAVCVTLQIGSMTVTHNYKTNELDTSKYTYLFNISNPVSYNVTQNEEKNENVFPLFKLGFATYGPIGVITAFFFGFIFSFCFEQKDVHPKLLSSFVHKKRMKTMEGLDREEMNDCSSL